MSLFFKIILSILLLFILVSGWVYMLALGSLPQISGQTGLMGLTDEVLVERDGRGVVTIQGHSRRDVAMATGFSHAQDRFFQMDLLRRKAAGELAALFGSRAIEMDVKNRTHGFRKLAQEVLAQSDQADLIQAYTQGVNQGLESLTKKPFEYFLLGAEPESWQAEDSVLVIYAMYLELQDGAYRQDMLFGAMQRHLPKELVEFLTPHGTEWDAPLDQSENLSDVPLPKSFRVASGPLNQAVLDESDSVYGQIGSNSWAVSGKLSTHGGALLAGDMHLNLSVPNIWYRLKLDWRSYQERHSVTGLSLPGLPYVIVGSNGYIAWSFTNSYGDWMDLVEFDANAWPIHSRHEEIEVLDQAVHQVHFSWSPWGPVVKESENGVAYALRWTAHHAEATNLNLAKLESVRNIEEGIEQAQRSGSPVQNIILVDHQGNIAWTLMGRLPERAKDFDTRFPLSVAQADSDWPQWLPIQAYPVVFNPSHQRLWSANARAVGGEALGKVGDGGYALGARAKQIKEALFAEALFSEQAFLELQLDDRALFLKRWQTLLLTVLSDDVISDQSERAKLKALVEQWEGRASVDSVSYRLVRAFRLFLAQRVFEMLLQPVQQNAVKVNYLDFLKHEGPLWQLVEARPEHLLSKDYANWDSLLVSVVDEVLQYFDERGIPLERARWGERNTLSMQHPLAMALPGFNKVLNMQAEGLPGDKYMPRVQGPGFGASQRMVVSPGKEQYGVIHMPGGQSGHPLSPFYATGHEDWVEGKASSFLPGEAVYTLRLLPHSVGAIANRE